MNISLSLISTRLIESFIYSAEITKRNKINKRVHYGKHSALPLRPHTPHLKKRKSFIVIWEREYK